MKQDSETLKSSAENFRLYYLARRLLEAGLSVHVPADEGKHFYAAHRDSPRALIVSMKGDYVELSVPVEAPEHRGYYAGVVVVVCAHRAAELIIVEYVEKDQREGLDSVFRDGGLPVCGTHENLTPLGIESFTHLVDFHTVDELRASPYLRWR